jgi:GPH family glycoside/pentoside/hexuronide:cation symporter
MKQDNPPFGLRDKLGYLFGDFGNDFTFLFAGIFLTVFYTKVLGIPTEVSGLLFLLARGIDAFTDITMGRIVDHARPRPNGRFRPWIAWMCGPVALGSFLMYQSGMAAAPMGLRIAYMFVTYILWGSILYTSINIPYGSMASALSPHADDRAALSTYRSVGAALAGVIVGAGAPLLLYTTDEAGNQVVLGSRFTLVAGLFSLGALVCYLLCYFMTTERVTYTPQPKAKAPNFLKTIRSVGQNRALLGVVLSAILILLASFLSQTVSQFLFVDYFKNSLGLSIVSIAGVIPVLLLAPLAVPLSRKFGKREASAVGCFLGGIVSLLLFALQTTSMWVYIALFLVVTLANSVFTLVVWAFITDVIDDQQVRTGKRDDGTIYGVYSFARKIGQALAGGFGGLLLGLIGYNEQVQVQSAEVAGRIYDLATAIPGVLYIFTGLCLLVIYPLSRQKVEENTAILRKMRGEE